MNRLRLHAAVSFAILLAFGACSAATASPLPIVSLEMAFIDDPAEPGDAVTVEYTLTNHDTLNPLSGLSFTHDLDATLPGLTATSLPLADVVGPGSTFTGTQMLTLVGGNLGPGESAIFQATMMVPASAGAADYPSMTSDVYQAGQFIAPKALDTLVVVPEPASLALLLAGGAPLVLRRVRGANA
jgi:hypothetical protein